MTFETKRVKLNSESRSGYYWRIIDNGKYHYYKATGDQRTRGSVSAKYEQRQKKLEEKKKELADPFVNAYEIEGQSHYDFRSSRVKSRFEYNIKGTFQYMPQPDKLELMTKNTLIHNFNSGRTKSAFMKKSLFSDLVDSQIRGFQVKTVRVRKSQIDNRFTGQLTITNNGNVWRSK